MLTSRQKDLIDYIGAETVRTGGVCPTYRQMGAALGVTLSAVHRLVVSCEERGALRRLPNKARAVELVAPPYDADDNARKSYQAAIDAMRVRHEAAKELILAAKEAAVMLADIARAANASPATSPGLVRLVDAIKQFEAVHP